MPTNNTEVQICNKALLRLAANPVESPDNTVANITTDSLEKKLCQSSFELIRDTVLEDRLWSFVLARAVLSVPDTEPPAFGYRQRFPIPQDALTIWRVDDQGSYDRSNGPNGTNISWSVEDGFILTNVDKCFVRYARRLDAETIRKASNQFVDALSLRLAVEWCMPLTENASMQKALIQEYQMRLVDASSIDGGQATHETIRANQLNTARSGWGY